ncbi:hypothetical protein [Marinimicrobium sp. ABcell2]|uniref:hypothetical protein n=1 Tax=Marinimicrobium sp. ABcell2 TaxID=3069751 RepID=UPI0027AFD057|nr:hypothetical protein [Marinimicrobium sp. ABcell2]MDQ2077349.1 hypothetical protein [Marinimicrobium sp. ABcell2]
MAELKDGEFYILDAPGINGMGSNSIQRMKDHAKRGGAFVHKMLPDENGVPQLSDQSGDTGRMPKA